MKVWVHRYTSVTASTVAAMKAGAASVDAADIDGFCAAAVELNGRANAAEVRFDRRDPLAADPPIVDVICAGDVFYEQPLADRALAWLRKAAELGARVLIGDPGRSYFPKSGLVKLAEYSVATTRELEDAEIKRTSVWTFPA